MIAVAIVFFILLGIGMIIGRRYLAEFQANVMGGRMAPGCVIAQAVLLFVLAVLIYIFRRTFE